MSTYLNLSQLNTISKTNSKNKIENESEVFEDNTLFVDGFYFKCKAMEIFEEFKILGENIQENQEPPSTDDIYECSVEEEIEKTIEIERANILRKRIFNLHKSKNEKECSLRNEALMVEEAVKKLKVPSFDKFYNDKFNGCELISYNFYKNFYDKKEIGKENNYIFNFNDSYLNEMTDIDRNFFDDYYKRNTNNEKTEKDFSFNKSNQSLELIYNFSIYHPLKNMKTQQIEVLGSATLKDLKEKIYCVIDEMNEYSKKEEIKEESFSFNEKCQNSDLKKTGAFFFIENIFYNDLSKTNLSLSSKIINVKKNKGVIKQEEPFHRNEFKYSDLFSTNKNYDFYTKNFYCNNLDRNKLEYIESEMSIDRIDHIIMRVGYPYLYRHQEYCDHMIMLNDIRIFDDYDFNTFTSEFGSIEKSVVTYQKKLKRRLCDFCGYNYCK